MIATRTLTVAGLGEVPRQLPSAVPCLRYGFSSVVLPGGLPRTCWALPWQLHPELFETSSVASRPLCSASQRHAALELLLDGQASGATAQSASIGTCSGKSSLPVEDAQVGVSAVGESRVEAAACQVTERDALAWPAVSVLGASMSWASPEAHVLPASIPPSTLAADANLLGVEVVADDSASGDSGPVHESTTAQKKKGAGQRQRMRARVASMERKIAELRTQQRRRSLSGIDKSLRLQQALVFRAWSNESSKARRIAAACAAATDKVLSLRSKCLAACEGHILRAERAEAERLGRLAVRAWGGLTASSQQLAEAFGESAERFAQLEHEAQHRLEALHARARGQRRSLRMQRSRLVKGFALRAWAAVTRASAEAAATQEKSGSASVTPRVSEVTPQADPTPDAANAGSPCACGSGSSWGCACRRSYSKELLLAHKELALRIASGPPGLERANGHQEAAALRVVRHDRLQLERNRVPSPPTSSKVVEVAKPDFHIRPRGVWAQRANCA
mmetsp:Transcript_112752/g.318711  ORF Transcript_112752/g.318711 Transcript_112752/m.318711 type:complete len:507 (-) Transcript_112752:164-1684(-)